MTSTTASESYWGFNTLVVDYLEHYNSHRPHRSSTDSPHLQVPSNAAGNRRTERSCSGEQLDDDLQPRAKTCIARPRDIAFV